MSLNRDEAKRMLDSIQKVLSKEFLDFDVKLGRATYDPQGRLTLKVVFSDNSATTDLQDSDTMYGMVRNGVRIYALGKSFMHLGKSHTVISCNKRMQKYCVVCEREDGKKFRFPASLINEKMKG